MMTNYYETLIEHERNSMKTEALKIAFEQAKLNILSMECVLENSLNTVKYNELWADLVANEVNADALILKNMIQKRKTAKLDLSQFSSSRQEERPKNNKFVYNVVNRHNNSPQKNSNFNNYNPLRMNNFNPSRMNNNNQKGTLSVKNNSGFQTRYGNHMY